MKATPEQLTVAPQRGTRAVILQRLAAELDELRSFVGKKTNRHWVWIAMDATTRQVIAFHVGDRSGQSALALWKKLPGVDQEHAVFDTEHSAAYTSVIPSAQHRAISKDNGTKPSSSTGKFTRSSVMTGADKNSPEVLSQSPKLGRTTNHVERFNCTLRRRVSRLVRAMLSFSKKLTNHIGAIKYFICHDNLTK
jgi:insertion element IS1 protein InsB